MGYYKDLGTGIVHDVCPLTGYPRNRWGHLLNCKEDNGLGLFRVGDELYNLTNPYGHLHFAIGDEDSFLCMDYAIVTSEGKNYLVVDLTYNSESGGYIGCAGYDVIPVTTDDEKVDALLQVKEQVYLSMDMETPHDSEGWNQEEDYFVRAIENSLFDRGWTDQEMRFRDRAIA